MRNSPKSCKFGKADRFPPIISQHTAEYKNFSTIIDHRYSTIGWGERGQFINDLPSFETPSPADYKADLYEPRIPAKGKTFGLGAKAYENVYIPGSHLVTPRNAAVIPSPAHYDTLYTPHSLGKSGQKLSITGKMPMKYPTTKEFPGPNVYKPNYSTVEQTKYQGISFGAGDRAGSTSFAGITMSPGPGTYLTMSPFDKFTRLATQGKGMQNDATKIVYKLKPIKLSNRTFVEPRTKEGDREMSMPAIKLCDDQHFSHI